MLSFDLHNLHLYSEEQVKAKRGFARYTATIGVLTMDNTLISRAVVAERIPNGGRPCRARRRRRRSWRRQSGRADGTESIVIPIPEGEEQVSLLGEKLTVDRIDGSASYTQAGRPIAVVSNFALEYKPGPPPRRKTGSKRREALRGQRLSKVRKVGRSSST